MSLKAALFATALSLTALPALAFGPQEFTAKEVSVQGLVGYLTVKVDSSVSKVTAKVDGPSKWVDQVKVRLDGNDLIIEQEDSPRDRRWRDKDDWVTVEVTVPTGTKLEIDSFTGEGTVGDLRAPFSVDGMNSGKLNVGRVSTAQIAIDGSGEIIVGDIDRDVEVEINGSGSVTTGRTAGKANMEINGSGDISLAYANGLVKAEINGSGDINVRGGVADPLDVQINGSGSVVMDGVAKNQSIEQSGSGSVRVTGKTS